jgi:RNA polymerase sigma-70 factor (ECF subfamily)
VWGKRQKSVSNLLFARIIPDRNRCRKGKFEKVPDKLEQQSWTRFGKGDADIWREFIDREIPLLYGLFMRRWPNRSLAEELVQRTVFDAVRGRGSYDPSRGSPEEWILGIARNNVRLEIRKRAGRPSINGDIGRYLEAIDTVPLPDEVLEREETAAIVRSALGRLESKEQAVLRTKYIDGLSARDIAQQMNTTEKAVYSLLYRAKISLRQELERLISLNKKE